MLINPMHIESRPRSHSVYTACDQQYFQQFGSALANSVLRNTDFDMHFHIFNPAAADLEFCRQHARITVSHEQVVEQQFLAAAEFWNSTPLDPVQQQHLDRTVNAMGKGGDVNIRHRMMKTYFACVRFVRLAEIFDPGWQMFAMDVDAVVRAPLTSPGHDHDFYIHRILGRRARWLAGGIWLNACSQNQRFLDQYCAAILDHFQRDYVYWGIDQDVLEHCVPGHNHGALPDTYIDWHMRPASLVWTAKGTRKNSAEFVSERAQYSV